MFGTCSKKINIEFLLKYSPFLNPMELAFNIIKINRDSMNNKMTSEICSSHSCIVRNFTRVAHTANYWQHHQGSGKKNQSHSYVAILSLIKKYDDTKAMSCVVKHRTAFSKQHDTFFHQPDNIQSMLGLAIVKNQQFIFNQRTDWFKRGHEFSMRGQPESNSGHAGVHARTVFCLYIVSNCWRHTLVCFPQISPPKALYERTREVTRDPSLYDPRVRRVLDSSRVFYWTGLYRPVQASWWKKIVAEKKKQRKKQEFPTASLLGTAVALLLFLIEEPQKAFFRGTCEGTAPKPVSGPAMSLPRFALNWPFLSFIHIPVSHQDRFMRSTFSWKQFPIVTKRSHQAVRLIAPSNLLNQRLVASLSTAMRLLDHITVIISISRIILHTHALPPYIPSSHLWFPDDVQVSFIDLKHFTAQRGSLSLGARRRGPSKSSSGLFFSGSSSSTSVSKTPGMLFITIFFALPAI
ncbi:hypothetical protein VP01_526g3 [Puccinia sorghi]|uniref:Uncharacterized protein n=1 Tax=Puccinia sorghi TaxID=27349 RepID=A0A0L6UMD2_9BASI|nr:hypothetical protein VP01_526g3 [Puccinia sorghi]